MWRDLTRCLPTPAMRIRYSAASFAVAALGIVAAGCNRNARTTRSAATEPLEWFSERAREAGLDFVHFNGMSGKLLYPELMAPGVALFDYDNDGDVDIFVVQGGML